MKKLLPILVGIVVLVGAGAGYFLFFAGSRPAAAEQDRPAAPPTPPVYVEFNPILLPIVGDGRVEQQVNIVFALEVANQEAANRAIAMAPRLNDAFLQALYGTLHRRDVMRDGVLNLAVVKRRLIEESNRILGQGVVRDVLVQMVNQQAR